MAIKLAVLKVDVLVVLLLADLWVHTVIGDYEVEVDFHSYSNPTGRCLLCAGGATGCCDVSSIVPLDQDCPAPGTCDTALTYCNRTVKSFGPCPQNEETLAPSVLLNRRSTFFGLDSTFFGLSNPVIISNTGPWQSLQILLIFRECSLSGTMCFVDTINVDLIDSIFINIDIAVGTSIQATYNGIASISHVTASIEVRCADGFYGPDCSTQCSNFVSCAGCGLPGFTGQFCQFCTDDYCNGNGNCIERSTLCDCNPGFTGDRCETNIDDCAGVNCNNGTCVDEISNFSCNCSAGFTGDRCEINIDDCEDIDCNNGMCIDAIDDFRCNCDTGFTGDHCETNIDYCEGVNCNNGMCVEENEDENFRCDCFTGFTGALCLDTSAAATAGAGSIAGGVVGGLIGVILIAIIVIIIVIVAVQVKRTKAHTFNGPGSGTGSAGLERNPSYGASPRSFQHQDSAGYQEIPSHRSNNSNGTSNNPVVASLQEREFDNPIYGSEEVQERELDNPIYGADDSAAEGVESEDPYTVPESPPSNVYDRVADDARVESVSASGGSNIYSTIPT